MSDVATDVRAWSRHLDALEVLADHPSIPVASVLPTGPLPAELAMRAAAVLDRLRTAEAAVGLVAEGVRRDLRSATTSRRRTFDGAPRPSTLDTVA